MALLAGAQGGERRAASTVRVRLAQAGPLVLEASTIDVSALDLEHGEELEAMGLSDDSRLGYVAAQLQGWPVVQGGMLPLRWQGHPLPLRVSRVLAQDGPTGSEGAPPDVQALSMGGAEATRTPLPMLRVGARARLD